MTCFGRLGYAVFLKYFNLSDVRKYIQCHDGYGMHIRNTPEKKSHPDRLIHTGNTHSLEGFVSCVA